MWRDIPGFNGYEASDWGGVRRKGASGTLSQWHASHGYLSVSIRKTGDSRGRPWMVHRLVAAAFIGAIENRVVRHLDGNKANNAASNLAVGSQAENIRDKATHGTQTRGETHGLSKLTGDQVRDIRGMLANGGKQSDIAEYFGVTPSNISAIKRNKSWTHLEG